LEIALSLWLPVRHGLIPARRSILARGWNALSSTRWQKALQLCRLDISAFGDRFTIAFGEVDPPKR
jgi:hypothetical protein